MDSNQLRRNIFVTFYGRDAFSNSSHPSLVDLWQRLEEKH